MTKDDHSRNPISCGITIPDTKEVAASLGIQLTYSECKYFLADNADTLRYLLEKSKALILEKTVAQHFASMLPEGTTDDDDETIDEIESYIKSELFDVEFEE